MTSFVALIPVFSKNFLDLILNLSKKQSSAQFFALPIILTLFMTNSHHHRMENYVREGCTGTNYNP